MKHTMTLTDAVQLYLQDLKDKGRNPITITAYGTDLHLVLTYFGKETLLETMRSTQVGKFYKAGILLERPNGEPRSPHTVSRVIRVFRMLMTWALDAGYIDALPLPKSTPMGRSRLQNE